MKLIQIVKNNRVKFSFYRQGLAWYQVHVTEKNADYIFPVPLEDVGNATLLAEDKAILFMRWIRRAIEDGKFVMS